MGANENPAGINGANKKAMKKQKTIQSSRIQKKGNWPSSCTFLLMKLVTDLL